MTDATHVAELLALSPSKRARALKRLDADQVLATLEEVRDVMDALPELRLALYKAGRAHEPKITQAEMGRAAGVSEPAVIQALKKDRLAHAS